MDDKAVQEEGTRILHILQQIPDAHRHERLMHDIARMIRQLLDLEPSEPFEAKQRLFELGFQSRSVIELKYRLETTFDVVLPVTLFFQHSTLGMLTTALLAKLPVSGNSARELSARPAIPLASRSEAEKISRLREKIAQVKKRLEP